MKANRQQATKFGMKFMCATVCLFSVSTSTARAGQLDQVLNRATQARDKAAAAAQNSAQAKEVGDEIRLRVEKVLNRTTNARDKATEIRDRILDAAENLTGDVKDAVTEAVRDVSDRISVQVAGKAAFESEYCEQFRGELIAMLENMQALDDTIRAMISPCQPAGAGGPTPLIDFLEQAPCGVLYPLYKVEIDWA